MTDETPTPATPATPETPEAPTVPDHRRGERRADSERRNVSNDRRREPTTKQHRIFGRERRAGERRAVEEAAEESE